MDVAQREQIHIGETTVTYLPDGEVRLNPALFPESTASGWARHAAYLDEDGRLPISVGSFLIRTPSFNALVDLGLGDVEFDVPGFASFRGGQLLASLSAEGLAPTDIDVVMFTHLHHDHVGWTTDVAPSPHGPHGAVGGLTFPNARHYVDRAEWKHWWGTDDLVGPSPDAVQEPLAEVVRFYDDPAFSLPGMQILATTGHTPGHSSIVVSDPGSDRALLILGDVMHTQAQVSEPGWNFQFDADPAQSRRTRIALLQRCAGTDDIVAGGHFAGSVFGQVSSPVAAHRWSRWHLMPAESADETVHEGVTA